MVFYSKYEGSMDPKFTMPNYRLGAPTNPTVAKQLEEFGKLLNQGVKNIEIGTLQADKFEFIPKEHFESIRQLAKMTGTGVSVHGPLMDLAGFDERSGKWSEESRKGTEQHVLSIFERSKALDDKGNIPIVFHAGATFSQEFRKGLMDETPRMENGNYARDKNGNVIWDKKPYDRGVSAMGVVNQDTGDVTRLEYEEKYSILDGKKHIYTPDKRLASINETQWDDEKLKVHSYQKDIEDLRQKIGQKLGQNQQIATDPNLINNPDAQSQVGRNIQDVNLFQQHMQRIQEKMNASCAELYDRFEKFAKTEDKAEFEKKRKEIDKQMNAGAWQQEAARWARQSQALTQQLEQEQNPQQKARIINELAAAQTRVLDYSTMLPTQAWVTKISEMETPQIWKPIADFSKEKTMQTVSNVMFSAYDKFKEKSPFIAIENFWPNTPMSTGKELAETIKGARDLFEKRLVNEKKMNPGEAKKVAEKLIGATWDVGHIQNLRKAGYEGEELRKKVIEETKEIAKSGVVKHVHITDNFGFHDSHLPPGMGDVEVGKILEELTKGGFKGRGIVEAGGFVAEIGGNPTQSILSYFESPLYSTDPRGGYWNTMNHPVYGGYRNSFIEFPQTHFNLYGSGFTTLPKEVGGQVGGERSRFSETPNA